MTPKTENPFIYIIGNNGSGKSRALEENAQEMSKSAPVVVISTSVSDKFTFGKSTKTYANGSYTYAGNRTVGNGLHTGTLAADVVINYLRLIDKKLAAQFRNFLATMGLEPVIGIRYEKKKRSGHLEPFPVSPLNTTFVKSHQDYLKDPSKPFMPMFKKNGNKYDFTELSSGEQSMVATALRVLAFREPDTIFYIDEPEISLHIEWQAKLPGLLLDLVKGILGIKVYVATHSPVIISSALSLGAECYSLKDGQYSLIKEEDLNVERIIFNEFHTLTPDNKHIYNEFARIISSVVDGMNHNKKTAKATATLEVKSLRTRVDNAAANSASKAELDATMLEFEKAVMEIMNSEEPAENDTGVVANE